jgi:hypothetical protein
MREPIRVRFGGAKLASEFEAVAAQKISSPTKNVGAPRAPRVTAFSVSWRNLLLDSQAHCSDDQSAWLDAGHLQAAGQDRPFAEFKRVAQAAR